MPYQAIWSVWPIVVIVDEARTYLHGSDVTDLNGLSIATRYPGLSKGICFGLCVRWIRRLFDRPNESPIARMSYLVKKNRFGSVAATQFIRHKIEEGLRREENSFAYSTEVEYSAAAKVSRLKFKQLFGTSQPENAGSIAQLSAKFRSGRIYYLGFCGHVTPLPPSVFFQSLGPAAPFGHGIVVAYDDAGPSKILDITLGELEIVQHQLGQFFDDYWRDWTKRGFTTEGVYLYEVTQVEEFADAHEYLGRNWDVNRSDIV